MAVERIFVVVPLICSGIHRVHLCMAYHLFLLEFDHLIYLIFVSITGHLDLHVVHRIIAGLRDEGLLVAIVVEEG